LAACTEQHLRSCEVADIDAFYMGQDRPMMDITPGAACSAHARYYQVGCLVSQDGRNLGKPGKLLW
jgi:hypothetical protein